MDGASTVTRAYRAKACPRFFSSNESAMMACAIGCRPPPPAPGSHDRSAAWEVRRRYHKEARNSEDRDAREKKTLAADNAGCPGSQRKNYSVRYEITGEHPSPFVGTGAEVAAMWGSATLAMEVSSTSMKAASATVAAMITD